MLRKQDTKKIVATVSIFVAISAAASLLPTFAGAVVVLTVLLTLLLVTMYRLNLDRKRDLAGNLHHIQAAFDLYSRGSFRQSLPPMTGWAASAALLSDISSEIRLREPQLILELGSGVSTIIMAYALEEIGAGRIVALEHSEDYAHRTLAELERHGLTPWVDLRIAPLKSIELGGRSWIWYDLDAIEGLANIDLVVVDGPPLETQSMARYPALPVLRDRLSRDAVIVLDDADRRDEQKCLDRWLAEFPDFTIEMRDSPKGTAILRRTAE